MSNVHRLPRPGGPDPAAEALTEARAIPEGHLDRIITDERAQLPPDPTPDEALERLVTNGDAVRFADHHWPGGIIRGLLDQLEETRRERDQARGIAVALECRVADALDEVRKHIKFQSTTGGLARTVESALDPRDDDEPDAAA